jgi:tetratricopeptide (TPR) repeat protein
MVQNFHRRLQTVFAISIVSMGLVAAVASQEKPQEQQPKTTRQEPRFQAKLTNMVISNQAAKTFLEQVDKKQMKKFVDAVEKRVVNELANVKNKCAVKVDIELTSDQDPKFKVFSKGTIDRSILQAIKKSVEKIEPLKLKSETVSFSVLFAVEKVEPLDKTQLAGVIENQYKSDERKRKISQAKGAEIDLVDELENARRDGWTLAIAMIENMPEFDAADFPALAELRAQLLKAIEAVDVTEPIEKWPAVDVDKLTINNPVFWAAYFETVPGNGYLEAVVAALLKANGEILRSLQIAVIARHGKFNSESTALAIKRCLNPNQRVINAASFRVGKGVEAFDSGKYDKAEKIFKDVLKDWPQFGMASYELGLTYFHQDEIAAGRKPPELGKLRIDPKTQIPGKRVYDLYAKSRAHDPMLKMGYQGSGMKDQLIVMFRVVWPAYQQISNLAAKKIDDRALESFAVGCQMVGLDDYALFARQTSVSRREKVGFGKQDAGYIKTSLNNLVPGKRTDETLKRLGGKSIKTYRFVN